MGIFADPRRVLTWLGGKVYLPTTPLPPWTPPFFDASSKRHPPRPFCPPNGPPRQFLTRGCKNSARGGSMCCFTKSFRIQICLRRVSLKGSFAGLDGGVPLRAYTPRRVSLRAQTPSFGTIFDHFGPRAAQTSKRSILGIILKLLYPQADK